MTHTPSFIITDPRCISSTLHQGSVSSLLPHRFIAESGRASAAAHGGEMHHDDPLVSAHDYW
jgi:hypothetical protein